MWYIILFVVAVIFFIFGFKCAKFHYCVNDLWTAIDILTEFSMGKISAEEALERHRKITDKYKNN